MVSSLFGVCLRPMGGRCRYLRGYVKHFPPLDHAANILCANI